MTLLSLIRMCFRKIEGIALRVVHKGRLGRLHEGGTKRTKQKKGCLLIKLENFKFARDKRTMAPLRGARLRDYPRPAVVDPERGRNKRQKQYVIGIKGN